MTLNLTLLAQADDSIFQSNNFTFTRLLQAGLTLVVAYILLSFGERLNHWLSERVPNRFRLIVRQSLPIYRAVILGVSAIAILQLFLKLSATNVLALTGTISLALGFAFKDYASSLIAGLVALFEVPYRVGDRVQIDSHYGEVISFGLRGIKLRTPSDNVVTIPHNKIWTEAISNSNDGALEAQVIADFYFAQDVDLDLVTKILYEAAYTSEYTQLKLPIVVTLDETPWATHLMLKAYPMDARDENLYKTDLLKRSKQAFAKNSIKYPPQWGYERQTSTK
ncbi:MAG: mechanosensitive ion channel family protein [Cyanobacteria bacterium P01_G01_bin.39]